jgi:hypothetical protein
LTLIEWDGVAPWRVPKQTVPLKALMLLYNNVAELRQKRGANSQFVSVLGVGRFFLSLPYYGAVGASL